MAQFDIYSNPVNSQRSDIPWCVDIQSDLLGGLPTRWVVPLAHRQHVPAGSPQRLCSPLQWAGETFFALPQMTAPFRAKDLGAAQGNVRFAANELMSAVDAVISGV